MQEHGMQAPIHARPCSRCAQSACLGAYLPRYLPASVGLTASTVLSPCAHAWTPLHRTNHRPNSFASVQARARPFQPVTRGFVASAGETPHEKSRTVWCLPPSSKRTLARFALSLSVMFHLDDMPGMNNKRLQRHRPFRVPRLPSSFLLPPFSLTPLPWQCKEGQGPPPANCR